LFYPEKLVGCLMANAILTRLRLLRSARQAAVGQACFENAPILKHFGAF
jgi:hypothetical protein